ncbi:unnamed protein product [Phytophthora fragariaefolia]|uniref:Unnamed protein product n=1 Tax=Phytophthora fragariaefolia TaxID=1490495 RepID=A0A9W6XT52_9STRA|nr:unnamed protein product [Phytophthora fragariaefolia]
MRKRVRFADHPPKKNTRGQNNSNRDGSVRPDSSNESLNECNRRPDNSNEDYEATQTGPDDSNKESWTPAAMPNAEVLIQLEPKKNDVAG